MCAFCRWGKRNPEKTFPKPNGTLCRRTEVTGSPENTIDKKCFLMMIGN